MVSALVLGCALSVAAADGTNPADLAAYQEAKTVAGRDADAHVALALWCEAHGMAAEKSKHLARAVLLDPSHAKARGLLGFVNQDGAWMRPEDVTRAVEESPERQAVFREYQERRVRARDKADDQNKLARWCDENGLTQQATAHFHRVVELDPSRDLAWKHLGFKKVKGQWVKPDELAAAKAEREAQAKADKHWKSRLAKLKDALSSPNKSKKAEALEELAKIDDPRAVPAVWAVFAEGDERWQRAALQVFSQIDAPTSSIALATMAVFHPSAELRSQASQALMRRDPRDFAGPLIGLLQDEIKYKVRAVSGPGSQGELFIKGKQGNVDRLYRPMQGPPQLPPGWVTLDDWGFAVVKLYLGSYTTQSTSYSPPAPDVTGSVAAMNILPGQLAPYFEKAGLVTQAAPMTHTSHPAVAPKGPPPGTGVFIPDASPTWHGAGVVYTPGYSYDEYTKTTTRNVNMTIPVGWMMMQARESAAVAQQQLSDDVRRLDDYNTAVRSLNERVRPLLKSASGRDVGPDRESWEKWFVDFEGYAFRSQPTPSPEPPTIVQDVPINYQPLPVMAPVSDQASGSSINQNHVVMPATVARTHACFAAGTLVRTLRGARPIEDLRAGDEVLTQDTSRGTLKYRPIVTAYHNPPNETFRLDLGKEAIVATGIHRFWKAGRGWVMARDVKAGDRLRTVGGLVEVVAVTKDEVQPVFNLQLDGGDDFCVGELGVIAHDNSLINPVEHPFDGVPALAELGPKSNP